MGLQHQNHYRQLSLVFHAANGQELLLQELKAADALSLFLFFRGLSPLSRSRFAPHAADYKSIRQLTAATTPATLRFIVRAKGADPILAYFLIQRELFPWELHRFREAGIDADPTASALLAPAVTDRWQGGGLGTLVYQQLEPVLIEQGIRQLFLWGGVQAANERACRWYRKLGFTDFNRFWHDGQENLDMMKRIHPELPQL